MALLPRPEESDVVIAPPGAGQGYGIDCERCTGCAVCFETCPCHAIEMIPEPA